MRRIELTSANVNASFAGGEKGYFIIRETVSLTGDAVSVPAGSILYFQGGHFMSAVSGRSVKLNLNGADVSGATCCAFGRDVEVLGFQNALVHADWFYDSDAGMEEYEAINKALVSAAGCPVTLEDRIYELTGAIAFPEGAPAIGCQTLISPGELKISKNRKDPDEQYPFTAIAVNTGNIRLHINTIRGIPHDNSDPDNVIVHPATGSGIRFTDTSQNVVVDVKFLTWLEKGIDISAAANSGNNLQIQNCSIEFQRIKADNCIYVDIFSGKNPSANDWFVDTRVVGGRLEGVNGIYFADPPAGVVTNNERINGLVFQSIGFEGLTGMPLRLRNMCMSSFIDSRMCESLPDGLIDMNNVFNLKIGIKSTLDVSRIHAGDNVKRVTVSAYFIDSTHMYYPRHFDTLVFTTPDGTNTVGTATCSFQSYDMGKTIVADKPAPQSGFAETVCDIVDMQPYNDVTYNGSASQFHILPRTINLVVKKGNNLILDFSGSRFFPLLLLDAFVRIEAGGILTVRVNKIPDKETLPYTIISIVDGNRKEGSSVSFTDDGLYRFTYDENWQLVITKVGK